MESIYYVLSWLCHRTCPHCYEERFHPYYGNERDRVVAEAREYFPRVIANLPERMTYLDRSSPSPGGAPVERRGRIILAGGEVLLEPIREPVLYPALEQLYEKYRNRGGVQLIVQTTGDLLTEKLVGELLARHVKTISVSGLDPYHAGLETEEAREDLRAKLTKIFDGFGLKAMDPSAPRPAADEAPGPPVYHFFGATRDSWIGPLWPRGRAHQNEISVATMADNFCNRWSGGLNFLAHRYSGSEVSIEPNGNVYPCCMKTKKPVGSLLEQPLETILDRLAGNPVYEAISMGQPERMGLQHGWTVETFLEKSRTVLPSGKEYRNLCVGCDRFHEEVLLPAASLVQLEPISG